MKTCRECGAELLSASDRFCHQCKAEHVHAGFSAEQNKNPCKQCGKELKAHWPKCPWCETVVEKGGKCKNCGEDLEAGMVLCPECGTELFSADDRFCHQYKAEQVQADSSAEQNKPECGQDDYDDEKDFEVVQYGSNAVKITAYKGSKTVINIPPKINALLVTRIGSHAFHQKRLTSVVIPNGVCSIDWHAFSENQLTSIVIPNSVRSIRRRAFYNNTLFSITIGDSVDMYDKGALTSNFTAYYKKCGRKAGTYVLVGKGDKWELK